MREERVRGGGRGGWEKGRAFRQGGGETFMRRKVILKGAYII